MSCTSLRNLGIMGCNGLTNLPLHFSSLNNLNLLPFDSQQMPSLSSLVLLNLPKLISLPQILPSYFSNLSTLTIGGFSDSVEFDWSALSSSLSLRRLQLNCWPNLVSLPDPVKHLTALTELELRDLGQIKDLPNWFSNLVCLEVLRISACEKLCHLPSVAAMRSLTKLSVLYIDGCPLLKERCTQPTSFNSEWAKISHIPQIMIDSERIKPGT